MRVKLRGSTHVCRIHMRLHFEMARFIVRRFDRRVALSRCQPSISIHTGRIGKKAHTELSVGVLGGLPMDAKAGTSLSPGSSAPSTLPFLLLVILPWPFWSRDDVLCRDGKGSTSAAAILTRRNCGGSGECECEGERAVGLEVVILNQKGVDCQAFRVLVLS
jgi:hypothetical protein